MSFAPIPCYCGSIYEASMFGLLLYYLLKYRGQKVWTSESKKLIAVFLALLLIPVIALIVADADLYSHAINIHKEYKTDEEKAAIQVAENYNYKTLFQSVGPHEQPEYITSKFVDEKRAAVEDAYRTLPLNNPSMEYIVKAHTIEGLICNISVNGIIWSHDGIIDSHEMDYYNILFYAKTVNGTLHPATLSRPFALGPIDLNDSFLVEMSLNVDLGNQGDTYHQYVVVDLKQEVEFMIVLPTEHYMA